MKSIMSRVGMEPGEPIYHPWLTRGIEKAQKRVEERNFEIRKHLLDYDDVLNEQRNYIYSQRDAILVDSDLSARVISTAEETLGDYVEDYAASLKKKNDNPEKDFLDKLKNSFALSLTAEDIEAHQNDINGFIVELLKKDIAQKEELAGKENLNMFIRYQYVQFIDRKWLDHLEQLEALREAVYLRSYGSKNPLTEYKIDGFNIFYEMIDSIKIEIASRIFRVKIQTGPDVRRGQTSRQMNAVHNAMDSFNAGDARKAAASSPMAKGRQGESVTVVRTMPKVGRNDPCPCGSGKKYKHCHGG
jgi:preprotein translocase subunit SecA